MRCIHIISGLGRGGAEGILFNLCLNDLANEHIVVSMTSDGVYGSLLRDSNIEVICLNIGSLVGAISNSLRLFKLIRLKKPDVVQTWMYHADFFGGTIARISGIKKIFWNVRHTHLDLKSTKLLTIIVAKLCARFSKIIPHKIICCSIKAIESHTRFGYDKEKFILISNGYDLVRFSPHHISSLPSLSLKKYNKSLPLIGMIARFTPEKDHKNLLTALHIVHKKGKQFSCMLIGEGMDSNNKTLMKLIKDYGLTSCIHLLGAQKEIPIYLNILDLHVLSSQNEAFPNVLAEAMACGIPCVVTNAGESKYILGDTGWLVEPNNSESLAEAIEEALDMMIDKLLWVDLKNQSRRRIVDNFSIKKMIEHYNIVWNDII